MKDEATEVARTAKFIREPLLSRLGKKKRPSTARDEQSDSIVEPGLSSTALPLAGHAMVTLPQNSSGSNVNCQVNRDHELPINDESGTSSSRSRAPECWLDP